ncbi:hypothetical protein NLG97_g4984 [Lecanicillium saksenae]|uniref:Uncharacterized protein n=1 Tax=Lecanicillium saksenae TaxID=468837 RepID=A0ACC1QUX9_9HYPO|nr:hypothetical protein NLG97_g4984 [Lecanicillium saksenae]
MSCKLAITSISLGRGTAGHDFAHKMSMAQQNGIEGVELFHEDLLVIAQSLPGGATKSNELEAARIIYSICQQRSIKVICLQPFWHYEGLADRCKHLEHIEKLNFWFLLAKALGTDMIQIPSSFLPATELSNDHQLAVDDLRKVADLGLAQTPPIRFVYEALAWGTRINTWEQSWEMVQMVDRPNFGLCLDTFNIAARVWADPTMKGCRTEDADDALELSLARMVQTVDVARVFCVQVVDAEKLTEPLLPGHEFHDDSQPPLMSWSRNCRLFYGERDKGAFLPIRRLSEIIFDGLGYEGWVSMELFHRRMADSEFDVPEQLATRAAVAWKKLIRDVHVKASPTSTTTCHDSLNRMAHRLRSIVPALAKLVRFNKTGTCKSALA